MINNNIITVNRGDTFSFSLFINAGTHISPVNLMLTDTMSVYVGVMEPNQKFENAIIRKRYTKSDEKELGDLEQSIVESESKNTQFQVVKTDNTDLGSNEFFYVKEFKRLIIKFVPDDTVNLTPGKYYMEIKLVDTSTDPETVTTISPKRLFYIVD